MDLEVLSCFILDFENSDQGKRSVMVGQVVVGRVMVGRVMVGQVRVGRPK